MVNQDKEDKNSCVALRNGGKRALFVDDDWGFRITVTSSEADNTRRNARNTMQSALQAKRPGPGARRQ